MSSYFHIVHTASFTVRLIVLLAVWMLRVHVATFFVVIIMTLFNGLRLVVLNRRICMYACSGIAPCLKFVDW